MPSLQVLAERIAAHAGGNPFFLEEIVLSLAETGVLEGRRGAYRLAREPQALTVPPTVQAVLAARIDRLGEREKEALQTAAVLGKEFPLRLLAKVSAIPETALEALLQPLVGGEFLYEESLFPEAIYAFKHPLTQEVAYQSQLSERRGAVHAAVARSLAEDDAERSDARAGLVAHHWERAGEILEAARWTRRAAEWAEMRNLGEALRHWRKLRDLVALVPESPESMALALAARGNIIGLGVWHGDPENQSATLFAEGRELAIRIGETRAARAPRIRVLGRPQLVGRRAGGDRAQPRRSAARRALRRRLDQAGAPRHARLRVRDRGPDRGRARADAARAARIRRPIRSSGAGALGFSPYAFFAYFAANLLTQLGRLARRARSSSARSSSRASSTSRTSRASRTASSAISPAVSETPRSRRSHAADAVRIAEALGSALSRTFAYRGLGISHFMSDEWQPAASALENALKIARESRTVLWVEPYVLADLAETYVALGRVADGRQTIARALEIVRRSRSKNALCHVQLARARVLLRTEGAAASADVAAALEDARQTGQPSYAPQIHLARAELAALQGDTGRRQHELGEAASAARTAIGALGYGVSPRVELEALDAQECPPERSGGLTMLAEVAASSLNDSIYFALVLSHREDFVWIFFASLALTVVALPSIVRGERPARDAPGSPRGLRGGSPAPRSRRRSLRRLPYRVRYRRRKRSGARSPPPSSPRVRARTERESAPSKGAGGRRG